MKKYIVFIFVALFSQIVYCQVHKILEKANYLYEQNEFYNAAAMYEQVFDKISSITEKADIAEKIGDCYYAFANYSKSINWYNTAYLLDTTNINYKIKYAESLYANGDYNRAFQLYQSLSNTPNLSFMIRQKLDGLKYAFEQLSNPPQYDIININELNTQYSEYYPFIYKNHLLFSSSRVLNSKDEIYSYNGQAFSKIFIATYDSSIGKWKNITPFNEKINNNINNGVATYVPSQNSLYFMRCNEPKGRGKLCNIYKANSVDLKNARADDINKIELNNKNYNVGHATFTSDGKTMYFVSDNPEGLGNKDLYVTTMNDDGQWNTPRNLGKSINTPNNEMFPVVVGDTMLYFSSNGFGGMGGLDILSCKIKNDVVISEAKLLPYPINSSGDDFGIVYLSNDRGIFTSNRNGGKGDDDFYYFTYAPVFLQAKGKVIDKNTRLPLAQTLITLSINDTIIDTTYTNNEGDYLFENIINDKKYIVKAIKRDYIPQEKELNTFGEKISRTLSSENGHNIDFELFKLTKEEIVINNIYYDFDKWTLRPESFVELDKILEILKENPQMIIQINSHTDDRGSDQYNQVLSEKRAQSVVDYLISKGISPSRLKYKGWGESNLLIKDAQTEDEHQLNRRTTFNLVNVDEWNQSYFDKIYSNVSEKYNEKSFFNHQIYIGSSLDNNIDSVIFIVSQYDTNLKITKITEDGIDRYYLGPFFLYDEAYSLFEKIKLIQPNAYIAIFKNDNPVGKIQLN